MRKWIKKGCVAALLVLVSCTVTAPGVVATQHNFGSKDDGCMASALYYEARGEPLAGKKAVMEVIENRSMATGKTICAVIKEPYQFSWYHPNRIRPMDDEMRWMLHEVREARPVLRNEKFQHFYSGPKPSWARSMICRLVGSQRFCKLKEK